MKMFNSSQTLVFLAIALVILAFVVPLKAQDGRQGYLAVHNQARRSVGVAPIRWHNDLAAYAQRYANKRRDCRLVHSGGRYGENLAWSSGDMSGAAAVRFWVNERRYYSYRSNTCSPGKQCGHYTQVVWRNSKWVGCAKVKCNNGGTFVICSYSPRGNIRGRKPY